MRVKHFVAIRVSILLCLLAPWAGASSVSGIGVHHNADTNADFKISLNELLRLIQFYNSDGFSCLEGTEDGYAPGAGAQTCDPHDVDFSIQDWQVDLTELLRMIQIYNSRVYGLDDTTEDGFVPIQDEEPPSEPAGEALALQEFILETPDEILAPETQSILIGLLLPAVQKLQAGDPCGAANDFEALLQELQAVRGDGSVKGRKAAAPVEVKAAGQKITIQTQQQFGEVSFALASQIQFDAVLGAPTSCPGFEEVGESPETEPGVQDTQGLVLAMDFKPPRLVPVILPDRGEVYTQLEIPGLELRLGEPGAPSVPCERHIIAVPPGAFISTEVTGVIGEKGIYLNLHPHQAQPVDQVQEDPEPDPNDLVPPEGEVFDDPEFVEDGQIYGTDRQFPPQLVTVTPLGLFRGLELAQIEICGGQYNPVSDELTLYDGFTVEVEFANGPAYFLPDWADNPFESDQDLYVSSVINSSAVLQAGRGLTINPNILGEELLILTHPNFRAAADTLAQWKNQKGIQTNVFEVGTGVADRASNSQIDAFIEGRYANTAIKASYILLLGDAEFIPPFISLGIGTDWPYAVIATPGVPDPLVPTFAMGRIPVDTLAQANTVVNKIIQYEQDPPGSAALIDAFYDNVTIASQFQCCRTDVAQPGTAQRTFAQVSEFVRNALLARGYSVQRIYQQTIDNAYHGDPTPRRYYDGSLLPASIGPGSGFSWNGTRQQVIDAFNDGRFLIIHRDHGWHSGWGHPPFDSNDVHFSLNNGAFQPVVFSINCSSGLFDNETNGGAEGSTPTGVYFAERLLRKADGGAVGVIGDTRVSPSWPNTALLRGLVDAVWPQTVPSFGSNVSKKRLGDILNHAKLYLWTQVGVSGQGTSLADFKNELRLYHVFGDPTMEMWTSDPESFVLSNLFQILEFNPQINQVTVAYELEDVLITSYQISPQAGLIPLGRGRVDNGQVVMDLVGTVDRELPILFAATQPDTVAASGSDDLPPVP